MIRVAKSGNVPVQLINKGVPATTENCRLYEANSDSYNKGTNKFEINSGIYGHKSVKEQLITEQHGKCCFCEANFTANGYGDVEHFRPKAGYTVTRSSELMRPGYYWLAYDWNNLYFSCQICNQRYKKNYFPLEVEANRAANHNHDYRREAPLLIHPSDDDPARHITFKRHIVKAKDRKGELSIKAFGINRPKLNEAREAYLRNVENNIAFAKVDLNTLTAEDKQQLSQLMQYPWTVLERLILTAKVFVAVAAGETKPFSAMVRANFPDLI